ncbi:cytochrome c oxidase subunit 7A2, mitochondrial [Nothoprocta perdicaria]|uniref:Cytochrome c oxidase subunit 7A2, mitochondrial n=1 Tax=Nothoprocta perdicaria TaxID=30464 RepID=A0A8C6ZUU3_NOTPE|nr:cytochrome c oxidase subunit 7A2, mitochondrial [Nothoprocta perdicaria]
MWRRLLALRPVSQRTISTASRRQIENRVAEKQKLFQEDNGIPVHLKGGLMDSLLYKVTMAITVLGTGYVLYELTVASMPKKQK